MDIMEESQRMELMECPEAAAVPAVASAKVASAAAAAAAALPPPPPPTPPPAFKVRKKSQVFGPLFGL